eukprot:CAMPEP_0194104004 /NCGR_PEP_ID=MMETSP0150-20130528/4342_1 /TAXON_ID=122233 /ORGANISM="Chaetoceros debilis, Strain MM31A-1" /LENGTH=57 /DNA_ID=CAMNT_0038791379 /DNA_START=54 /DNA_END=223 /DNA_ORIENTATION=-
MASQIPLREVSPGAASVPVAVKTALLPGPGRTSPLASLTPLISQSNKRFHVTISRLV